MYKAWLESRADGWLVRVGSKGSEAPVLGLGQGMNQRRCVEAGANYRTRNPDQFPYYMHWTKNYTYLGPSIMYWTKTKPI